MRYNEVIKWLKEYFDKPAFSEEKLKPVFHFSLLWNLFEHTYFSDDSRLTNGNLLELAENSFTHIPNGAIQTIYIYFKNRYFPDDREDTKFEQLCLDKRVNNGVSYFEYCREILLNSDSEKVDKLKCLFLIIYRFRNNLFHGRKQPRMLHTYQAPFNSINRFLMAFIKNYSKD
jgi:hypothetical protein